MCIKDQSMWIVIVQLMQVIVMVEIHNLVSIDGGRMVGDGHV